MRSYHSTPLGFVSALTALILLFATEVPARGGDRDAVFLIPRDSATFTIDKAALPSDGADPEALVIVSWSPPSRGALTETPTTFTYTPSNTFRLKGSDSFRYRFLSKQGISMATVFLVADLGPGDGSGDPRGETTAGGNTVLVLDIGSRWTGDSPALPTTAELARAEDHAGDIRFDLLLTEHPGGQRTLQARAYENGTEAILAPLVELAEGRHVIRLDWWASSSQARNGGLLIRRDDTLVSQIVGLDNAFQGGLRWTTQSTIASPPSATQSVLQTYERSVAIPMAFPPGFADTFEDGTFDGWRPSGQAEWNSVYPAGLTVSDDAATEGTLGLRADLSQAGDNATLLEPSPPAVARYRARFDVRIDAACSGASELLPDRKLTLLAGLDAAMERTLFELGVLFGGEGTFRLILKAVDDQGAWQTYVQPSPLHETALIDLEWWSATDSATANGGLALRLNGVEAPLQVLPLSNPQQRIGGIHFGAVALEPGGRGSICLDELESWF